MLLTLLVAGLALGGLLAWFVSLEGRDERHKIFVMLVIVMLVEAMLAGRAAEVPRGILRPVIAGQDFRPPDAIIVAALGARILHLGNTFTRLSGLWAAFLAIYVTSALVGILNGFNTVEVLFQAKGSFYLLGGMAIASGADPKRLADGLSRFSLVAAGAATAAVLMTFAGVRLSFSLPGQRINSLGALSADSITLLTTIGVFTVVVEAVREERRWPQIAAGLVLLISPIAGTQRASYMVLVVMILVLLLLFSTSTWKRRSSVTVVEVSLVVAGLIGAVGLNFVIAEGEQVVAPFEEAFTGAAEQRSAESRFGLADQAVDRIQERPILGWGTGVKVVRQAEFSNREVNAAAHNLILDIGMRVGITGLLVFTIACVASVATGLALWRQARSDVVAAVAAAATVSLIGVLAKGMVEPALDKFRLSLTFGISIGLIMAARMADERGDEPDETPDDGDGRHEDDDEDLIGFRTTVELMSWDAAPLPSDHRAPRDP